MIKLWNEGVRDYRIFRYLIVFIPLNNIIKELKKNAIYIYILNLLNQQKKNFTQCQKFGQKLNKLVF